MPVPTRTRNEYIAISPSRNDQWSGKTYRSAFFPSGATPVRESRNRTAPRITRSSSRGRLQATPPSLPPDPPPARADGAAEVAAGAERAVAAQLEGELRERPPGRAE